MKCEFLFTKWRKGESMMKESNHLRLMHPSIAYEEDILSYREEFLKSKETMAGCGNLENMESIAEWIDRNEKDMKKETLTPGHVTADLFLAIRNTDNKVVGMINFRHELSERLLRFGGNIGFSIRPSEQNQGLAKEMLRLCLEKCREKGLTQVLITCKTTNPRSRKVIQALGGIHQDTTYFEPELAFIERYWIRL